MLLIRLLFKEKRNEHQIRIMGKKIVRLLAAAWNHLNEFGSRGPMPASRGSYRIFSGALFYAEFCA